VLKLLNYYCLIEVIFGIIFLVFFCLLRVNYLFMDFAWHVKSALILELTVISLHDLGLPEDGGIKMGGRRRKEKERKGAESERAEGKNDRR
jgi:hypothetical protein